MISSTMKSTYNKTGNERLT